MKCVKTGRPLVWRGDHVYQGDEFNCTCGNSVVYSNSNPYHLERALAVLDDEEPIKMDKDI